MDKGTCIEAVVHIFLGSGTVHRVPGTHMGFSLIHLLGCSRVGLSQGRNQFISLACAIVGMKECFLFNLSRGEVAKSREGVER